MSAAEEVAIARAIAHIAHRGQVDKAGEPYINHPMRVAAAFNGRSDAGRFQTVAWLHDVLEDTDLTRDDLNAAGIRWLTVVEVEKLTRTTGNAADYYETIRSSEVARAVKLADIADNMNPIRLAKLDDATIARLTRKYAKAGEALCG